MTKGGHNYAQKEYFTSKSKYADLCKNYRSLLTFKSLALTKKTMPMIIVGWDCRKKYPALLIGMGFNNTICKISRCCCGLLSGEWKRSLTIIFKFNYCLHFTTNFKANFALPASNLYKKSCQSSIFCTGRKITVLQMNNCCLQQNSKECNLDLRRLQTHIVKLHNLVGIFP